MSCQSGGHGGPGSGEGVLAKQEEHHADDLIPILQEIQEAYGYLPAEVLRWVSERTGIPTSRMYGVITFYAQFYLQPHGKHTVRCCRGTACHVRGGKKIINAVKGQLGIEDGETTEDMQLLPGDGGLPGGLRAVAGHGGGQRLPRKDDPAPRRADPAAARAGGRAMTRLRLGAGFPASGMSGSSPALDPNRKVVTICGGTGCTAFGSPAVQAGLRAGAGQAASGRQDPGEGHGLPRVLREGPGGGHPAQQGLLPQREGGGRAPDRREDRAGRGGHRGAALRGPGHRPRVVYDHEVPFYARQKRLVFRLNGTVDPTDLEDYIAHDGYRAMVKALSRNDPGTGHRRGARGGPARPRRGGLPHRA